MCERVWDLRDLSLVALESVDTVECSCVEHTGSSCRENGVPRCNEISQYLMDAGHLIIHIHVENTHFWRANCLKQRFSHQNATVSQDDKDD